MIQAFWIDDPDAARTGQVYDLRINGAAKSMSAFFEILKEGVGHPSAEFEVRSLE